MGRCAAQAVMEPTLSDCHEVSGDEDEVFCCTISISLHAVDIHHGCWVNIHSKYRYTILYIIIKFRHTILYIIYNLIVSRVYEDPMFCIYGEQDFVA